VKALAVALLAVALLGACGGGKGEKPAAAPAPTTTTVAAGCPALPAGPAAFEATNAAGDFDGDGRQDRLVTARAAAGGAWKVRMELAAGGGAEAELPASAQGVKAVGGTALDVTPGQAAFAVVGQGAGGPNVGLFVLQACKLQRVTLAGQPAEFPVGTSAGGRTGVACQVPGLVVYQATTDDGRFYQGSTVTYLLVGTLLDEVHRARFTLGADDPALTPYGRLTCGTLAL